MYAIITHNFDYNNISFKKNKEDAQKKFNEEKENFDSTYISVTLIKIKGDGEIYFGIDLENDETIEIIDHITNE